MNLMQKHLDIFDDYYPRLSKYARSAEECINAGEYNLCMLYLGRIAETIIQILCRRNNIPCDDGETNLAGKLLEQHRITRNINLKVKAITELHDDADRYSYDSPVACKRMYEEAVELCEWFISIQRFNFLKNLIFPKTSSENHFPFSKLARLGKETEDNIYPLTRYGLLCLGNMGEEICMLLAIRFMNMITVEKVSSFRSIEDENGNDMNLKIIEEVLRSERPNKEEIENRIRKLEQALRIKFLQHCGIIEEEQKKILKNILAPRNGAVHGEINLEGEIITYYTKHNDRRDINLDRLLNDTASLCVWTFRKFLSAGCILKGMVQTVTPRSIKVSFGPVYGFVSGKEMRYVKECKTGGIYPFEVLSIEREKINLGMQWMILAKRYEKYHKGEEVRVTVIELQNEKGVRVELNDGEEKGLAGFIPNNETDNAVLCSSQEINAKIIGFTMEYPYMFLTMKGVEQKDIHSVDDDGKTALSIAVESHIKDNVTSLLRRKANPLAGHEGMTAFDIAHSTLAETDEIRILIETKAADILLDMCCSNNDNEDQILKAIEQGVNVNHMADISKTTTLMNASRYKSARIIEALIEHGANIEDTNHEGNNALIMSAMYNDESVVEVLLNNKADVTHANKEGKTAKYYAEHNDKIQNPEIISRLSPETERHEIIAEEEKHKLQIDFLKLCKSGNKEEISRAVSAGVNINVMNRTQATGLMFAAQRNTANVIEILVDFGIDIDAQDIHGNTALIYAASYNNEDAVDMLIGKGANVNIINNTGNKALNFGRKNPKLKDTEALRVLEELTKN